MTAPILRKTLRDQARPLLWWTLGLILFVAMYVAIWPGVQGQPSMQDFIDQMPEAFRNLFATSGADMSTPVGYIQIELMSFMAPILILLYTVSAGSSAVAGEESRRTLDLLVSAPVSRTRIVLEKMAAMVVGTVVLVVVLALSLLLEGRLVDLDLPAGGVAAAMLHLALLGLVFGVLALAVGAATGLPGLSRAAPGLVAVVAYVVNGLGSIVDWLRPVQKFSPFYQYAGHDPLRTGVSWPAVLVAVVTVLVLLAIGVVGLRRRDLRS